MGPPFRAAPAVSRPVFRRRTPRPQRPLAVQFGLDGFERRQRLRAFVQHVLRTDQVLHEVVELRLQLLLAEVFDFVTGDELRHVCSPYLWAATTAALMTRTSAA